MNKVFLLGNLVEDVRVFENKDGIRVVKGTIAISRKTKKKESDYIAFTVLGNSVDYAEKYGKKGVRVLIQGSWNHSTFKDKEGKSKSVDACLVEEIKIMGERQIVENVVEEQSQSNLDIADDDLPF